MKEKNTVFTFLLTGIRNNDRAADYFAEKLGYEECKKYKLDYTEPYRDFNGIMQFQEKIKYRPFLDSLKKNALVNIDLSEWAGHEEDEYLHLFFQFLHDYDGFYQFHYVFTVGDLMDKRKFQNLYDVAVEYLWEGEIIEDKTLTEVQAMTDYLLKKFPLDGNLADRFSRIFIRNQINSYMKMDSLLNDFVEKIRSCKESAVTEERLFKHFAKVKNTRIFHLFETEMLEWKKEYENDLEKKEAA